MLGLRQRCPDVLTANSNVKSCFRCSWSCIKSVAVGTPTITQAGMYRSHLKSITRGTCAKFRRKWVAKVAAHRYPTHHGAPSGVESRKLSLDAFHFPRGSIKTLVLAPLRMREPGTRRCSCDSAGRILVSLLKRRQEEGTTRSRQGGRVGEGKWPGKTNGVGRMRGCDKSRGMEGTGEISEGIGT